MEQSDWMLVAVEGHFSGRQIQVTDQGVTFGRDAENSLVLDDDRISRCHARVRVVQGQLMLEDLQSRNGTFVNNQRVQRVVLGDNDRIALGSHIFVVRSGQAVGPGLDEQTVVRPTTPLHATQAIAVAPVESPSPAPRLNLAVAAAPEASPVFGGAASVLPPVLELAPPQASIDALYPPPEGSAVTRKRSPLLLGVGVALVLSVVIGAASLLGGRGSNASVASQDPARAQEPAPLTAAEPGLAARLDAPGPAGLCRPATLTPEEQALKPEDKVNRANEHFDEGERHAESNKLTEACGEFEKALALNPDCQVCLLRLSRVKGEIRKSLEKFESDALRSYQAMEYDKAVRYWQMVLELESDPAGRQRATEELKKARAQLHQQSYR